MLLGNIDKQLLVLLICVAMAMPSKFVQPILIFVPFFQLQRTACGMSYDLLGGFSNIFDNKE
jgi:hypothetical protein